MKAVIFDLFETLVDFSLQRYDEMLFSMAESLGTERHPFVAVWHKNWEHYEVGSFASPSDIYYEHHRPGRIGLAGNGGVHTSEF